MAGPEAAIAGGAETSKQSDIEQQKKILLLLF